MLEPARQLIRERRLTFLFQPIIHARDRAVIGYEALVRGPSDSPLHSPSMLFEAAAREGVVPDLDRLCFELAVARRTELGLPGRLFVNLTPQGLLSFRGRTADVADILRRNDVPPEAVVIELTEQAILDDYDAIRGVMTEIQALGAAFAIDDLGSGYSGLRAWSELHPEFVKIDRYFISNIDSDALKMEFVRAIIDLARAARSTVIAEGIETAAEAAELVDAGVALLQGFYVSRPQADPVPEMSDTMIQRCPAGEFLADTMIARDLVRADSAVSPDIPVPKIAELFHEHVDVDAFAVVDRGRPVGIVRRVELLDLLSIPLRRELYLRKPISTLMDTNPLLVDADLRLEQVSRLVTRGFRERLQEQFIVTDHGKYIGLARMVDLLRSITQEQIRVARYSNPLTTLPGSVPIYDFVNRLLRRGKRFVLAHVDIDHFKPFNDIYGYAKGDEALLIVAKTIGAHTSPRVDFLGHVGGDDFVIAFRSHDWRDRLERALADVARELAALYKPEHVAQGGILTTDRYGVRRLFPLLSMSVGALVCDIATTDVSAEDLSYHLAPLKARAKTRSGNTIEVERYGDIAQRLTHDAELASA
jgi:EAL domain-containing protein (putative c-di-GMP-specific phosphodiesterase class I)/GGDEF domain-containing protein